LPDPEDQGYFGWGDAGALWGARLKGGCNFTFDFKNKKFALNTNYVASIDFGEGHIERNHYYCLQIYAGLDRIYALFHEIFDWFTDDFKLFLYQCGTGYYYETDYSQPIKEGESLKSWR
jgi:hypothetical protein